MRVCVCVCVGGGAPFRYVDTFFSAEMSQLLGFLFQKFEPEKSD